MSTDPTYLATIDDDVVRRFEAAWRAGERPAVEQFLPREGRLFLPTLEELVHIDLEFRWKSADGTRPAPVEEYLRRFPALDEPAVVRRLVRQEIELRGRRGERPEQTEYQERFPSLGLDTPVLNGDPSATVARGCAVAALSAGDRVGRYRLNVEHARGGFGLVWRAEDAALGREVALKQLSVDLAGDGETRRRFLAEARVAARLQHPGVVPVYDVADAGSTHPFYTMKLVSGQTLTEAIRRFHEKADDGERGVEQLRLLNAFLAVVRTVAFAHSRGVIHRDLKPDNIVLGEYGETVLLDWGLAKVKQEAAGAAPAAGGPDGDVDLTQQGTVLGTPAYMAPEQAEGATDLVDERSDIHGLGVILYQLLTGKRPFPARTLPEVLAQVREHAPARPRELRTGLARPLEAICLKAMAKRREDRYGSADELARDLERHLADEPVSAYRERPRERLARRARRHRTAVAAGGVALVLLLLGAVAGVLLRRDAEHQRQLREEARLAELRRAAQSAEDSGLAEMRRGRYGNAETLFEQAVRTVADEPKLHDRREQLGRRLARARAVVAFYRELDRGEESALYEKDRQAMAHFKAALGSLNLLGAPNWVEALPAEELIDDRADDPQAQLGQLREDVYRAVVFRGALLLKLNFMKDDRDPGLKAALREVVELFEASEQLRPSFSANLVKSYCFFRLRDFARLAAVKPSGHTSATDYHLSGMAHIWMAKFPDNPITKELQHPFLRQRMKAIGLDFDRPREVAREHFRNSTDREPAHYWGRIWLAWCLELSGDLAGAAEAYEACIALRPAYWLAYGFRGDALAQLARKAKEKNDPATAALERRALADVNRAVKDGPWEPDPVWHRYRALAALGRAEEAFPDLGRIVDRQRPLGEFAFEPLQPELVRIYTEVRDFAGQRTQKSPQDADAWSTLAGAQQLLGQTEPAILSSEAALKIKGDHVRALTVRGQARLEQKRFSDALADFTAALAADPAHPPAGLGRARALEALGRDAEALSAFEDLLKRSQSDWYRGEAHLGRARSLKRLGRAEEARKAVVEDAAPFHPQGAARTLQQLFP